MIRLHRQLSVRHNCRILTWPTRGTAMRGNTAARLLLMTLLSIALCSRMNPQMPPKSNRTGNPVSIVRNDAADTVTIEVANNNEWQQLEIGAGKDATVSGDRIRVATKRKDKATV